MKNTIMIVDDVDINIELLRVILDEEYQVESAVGGKEAIAKLHKVKPDLLLLDLSMPEVDGFAVLRYMKSQDDLKGIPVIFVTGEQDEFSEEKGLALGAVDYVKKPYNADVISARVRNHVELKTYRDKLEVLVRERTHQLEERSQELAAANEAIIMGMSLMSESHDKVTGEHIGRIKEFTRILSYHLTETHPEIMNKTLADAITMYSPLHDVGKIAISDSILKKTGKLTDEEFTIMKNHTIYGGDLLRKTKEFLTRGSNELQVAIDIAERHHERYDGTGYPQRMVGEDIPIAARIVSMADIYDALRSPRPYKATMTHEEAYQIITEGDGRTMPEHFDPKVLQAFKDVHLDFLKTYPPIV